MNKMKKTVISMALAGVMIFVTACGGTSFDASGYVKSCLDLLTKCEYEKYVEFVDCSEEEAKANYEDSIDNMMEDIDSIGLSEELLAKYRGFYEEVYKATKYEVLEAVEGDDGSFTVDIEIEQITGVFNGVSDELNAAASAYGEELAQSGETLDDAEISEWVYNKLYEILNENMAELTYKEKQTVTVRVLVEDNTYYIPDEDYEAIDAALIDLGDLV